MPETKNVFSSIVIHIPEDMVAKTSKGTITIKQSMTKSKNLSKVRKEPSVQIKTDPNITKPVIENQGEVQEVEIKPKKQRKTKTIKLKTERAKPIPKDNRTRVEELRAENKKLYASLKDAENLDERRAIMAKVKILTDEINKLKVN